MHFHLYVYFFEHVLTSNSCFSCSDCSCLCVFCWSLTVIFSESSSQLQSHFFNHNFIESTFHSQLFRVPFLYYSLVFRVIFSELSQHFRVIISQSSFQSHLLRVIILESSFQNHLFRPIFLQSLCQSNCFRKLFQIQYFKVIFSVMKILVHLLSRPYSWLKGHIFHFFLCSNSFVLHC